MVKSHSDSETVQVLPLWKRCRSLVSKVSLLELLLSPQQLMESDLFQLVSRRKCFTRNFTSNIWQVCPMDTVMLMQANRLIRKSKKRYISFLFLICSWITNIWPPFCFYLFLHQFVWKPLHCANLLNIIIKDCEIERSVFSFIFPLCIKSCMKSRLVFVHINVYIMVTTSICILLYLL